METIFLYPNDFVLLDADGNFLKLTDGQIVIYGDRDEAEYDCYEGETVVSAADLSEEKKEELILNIYQYQNK